MIAPAAEPAERTREVSAGKLNTIVCGTDFSIHAKEAANAAAALARRTGATLVLVHAYDPAAAPHDPILFRAASARAEQQLATETRRLRDSGIRIEEQFLTGVPAAALSETVNRRQAGLLIVSSLGVIAPRRFVVPSVAQGAAENSAVPTLVVRQAAPFENWAKGISPLKVFVAYDLSSTADSALQWARMLREIGPCEFTVAFTPYPPQESWRLGIGEHLYMDALPPEIHRVINCDLKERIGEILGLDEVKIRIEAAWGRPDPVLLSLAREAEADLIVVGTHQRHGFGRFWLGSVSRGILRAAPCSVAVVPRAHITGEGVQQIPSIRRVVVTTDFSELGNRAIPHAYSLLPAGGTVCLVHVEVPDTVSDPSDARLRSLIPPETENRGIATVLDVVQSHRFADAICQAAERFDADVLCIASHGRSGISKTFMGSIAQEVMARSSRPVLVVRAPSD